MSTVLKQQSMDEPIYKVKLMEKGRVKTIFVFYGDKSPKNKQELYTKIFSDEENAEIKKQKIPVKFSQHKIHFDDSIGTIKIKIVDELERSDISLEEIYLFCQKFELLNTVSIYQILTQNRKYSLTPVRLDQFISNIVGFEKPVKKEKEYIYTFDEIFEMKLDNTKYIMNTVTGHHAEVFENDFPFVIFKL
jgi:hypothetical protein